MAHTYYSIPKIFDSAGVVSKINKMIMYLIKQIFIIWLLVILPIAIVHAQKIDVNTYITDHKVLAKILAETYGMPSSVILGVAIVESSAGTCDIAKVLNNHFGIVGKNDYINKNKRKSMYRQYDNEIASYIDFCIYVSTKKFYQKLKNKKDPRLWVHAISLTGYAEDPENWEGKIMHTIKLYHLK